MEITEDNIFCEGDYFVRDIRVVGDNIVLDCNGATLNGNSGGLGIRIDGIIYDRFFSDITIMNCNLEDYSTGITIFNARNIILIDNNIVDSETGMEIGSPHEGITDNVSILDSSFSNSLFKAINFDNTNNGLIEGNVFRNNGDPNNPGRPSLRITGINNRIYNNNFFDNGVTDANINLNTYCVNGVGNNYFNGATGPSCSCIPTNPSEEICDDLDNDCDGEIDGFVNGADICDESRFIAINSPILEVYGDKKISLDIQISEIVDEITYIDNSDSRPRERRLCRNCEEYNRSKSFRDGFHELEIRAYLDRDIIDSKEVNFTIDSRAPRLGKSSPGRGFANGIFNIEFREDNPENLILNYGNDLIGLRGTNVNLNNCIKERRSTSCTIEVNLSDYNNEEIDYWFEITDIVGNIDDGRIISLDVDSIDPLVLDFNYSINRKRVEFIFEIDEDNFDEITYVDQNDRRPRERRLCSRLRGGECNAKKSFRTGDHNVTLTIKDDAGNSFVLENNLFTI